MQPKSKTAAAIREAIEEAEAIGRDDIVERLEIALATLAKRHPKPNDA